MMYRNGDFSKVPEFIHATAKPDRVAALFLDCARYGVKFRKADTEAITPVALDLIRQARLLTELALCECNGVRHANGSVHVSTEEQAQIDHGILTAREHVRKDVAALFDGACVVEFNRDPRGAPFSIETDDAKIFVQGV